MKILVVCQYFFPEQFKVNDICFELVSMGHKVTVLTGLPNYPSGVVQQEYRWLRKRHEFIHGVEVIRAPLVGRGSGKLRLALNYISFAFSASLKALFIKKDFDVILVFQLSPVTMALPAILLKKITGKKIVLFCQDLWPESIAAAGITAESSVYRFLLSLSRWIYQSADKITISSRMFRNFFREVIGIESNLKYLPVYAENFFEEIESKKADSEHVNLVFAGNIGELQSVETIIHAANRLKEFKHIRWHIVGGGSAREKCELLAKGLGLDNVIFYGQRPITDMPHFYSLANAFLVTLKANKVISYTLPNKVQSYMASSKPIIGAIDGETRMVIEEANCGLCCEAEDDEVLSNLVIEFQNSKEMQLEFGLNSRKYYDEHFSKGMFFRQLINLLEEVKGNSDV